MEILNNFGFEPTFFFAQIVNFLILAFVFKRFLYKPVLKMLADRRNQIEKGIADALNAQKQLEEAEAKHNKIIKEATLAAEKIIDETKASAEELRASLAASAKEESEKIILEAKSAADQQFKDAAEKAEDIALSLSKKIVDKVISDIFTKEEKAKIVSRNIKRLEQIS